MGRAKTKDMDVQTDNSMPSSSDDISIHELTTRQINLLNEVKRIMRTKNVGSLDHLQEEMRAECRRKENSLMADSMKFIQQMSQERLSQENRYTRGEPSFAAAHRGVDFDMITSLRPAGFRESPPRKSKKRKYIH
jgi:hypothetical protein